MIMNGLLLALLLSIITIFPSSGNAGVRAHQVATISGGDKLQETPNQEMYRGYFFDLSEMAGQQNYGAIADVLRHQVDIIESVGLSPRVLNFFHTVPIVVDEWACLSAEDPKVQAIACYGPHRPEPSLRKSHLVGTFWDNEKHEWANPNPVDLAEDTGRGLVMVRPLPLAMGPQEPVLLHEMLHAYHTLILPQGVKNPAILLHYNAAKSQLYPADAYALSNEKEFFAVTASIFLYGKSVHEPLTRSNLKQKQPDYYKYLAWLFGFDPEHRPGTSPIASADSPVPPSSLQVVPSAAAGAPVPLAAQ
jgi:hypothetical protein